MSKRQLNPRKSGYIYILTNSTYLPGLMKIGETQGNVDKRMRKLSHSTSVPTPFKKEFICKVKNRKLAETTIHYLLYHHRINKKREFFKMNIDDAIHTVKAVCVCIDQDIQCANDGE